MIINLSLKKSIFAPYAYEHIFDYSKRGECGMGSAGSAKSYSITQKLIIRACTEQIRILVCRRYGTTIRNTVFALFKEIFKKGNIIQYVKVNESDYRIKFPNGSEILFQGLDEETKLLSLTNISTVGIEEAYEVPKDIIDQLNLRMRGNNANQQIIMSWNPISKNHGLYDFVNNPPESFTYIHSTYKDNPFLNDEYVKALEELYVKNPQKARVFCDGEGGVNKDSLVFNNGDVSEFNALELSRTLEHRAGSDMGFIDPTAIIDTLYDKDNGVIYVFNEFYQTGCQLDEIYSKMLSMNLTRVPVYMDSAEPRSIDYFKRKGLNVKPCIKGANSVNSRIAFLQNNKILVDPHCINLIRELENFSYKFDKRTNSYIDETTHEGSHAIDALGYAYSDIYTKNKLRTIEKGVLGL